MKCVSELEFKEPEFPLSRLIVIDDGIDWELAPGVRERATVIPGVKPFVYARNVNLGIESCDTDVILLNDDAELLTPWGFSNLSEQANKNDIGILSAAVHGVVANPAQRPNPPTAAEIRIGASMVAFVCVYIRRQVINSIGLLDERYVDYGYDDNDYCRRVFEAGFSIGVSDHCIVDHRHIRKSTYRSEKGWEGLMDKNRKRFEEKWNG